MGVIWGKGAIFVHSNNFSVSVLSVCQFIQNRSTDIHDGAGPSLHSTLLMAPEQQLLKFLQAHIHILHSIGNLYPAQTHNTHTQSNTDT